MVVVVVVAAAEVVVVFAGKVAAAEEEVAVVAGGVRGGGAVEAVFEVDVVVFWYVIFFFRVKLCVCVVCQVFFCSRFHDVRCKREDVVHGVRRMTRAAGVLWGHESALVILPFFLFIFVVGMHPGG